MTSIDVRLRAPALAGLLAALLAAPGHAAELLAAPFTDHAVLQRDRPIPVWGQAGPGSEVQVELAGQRVHTRAGRDGRWQVQLPALPAGGPYPLQARAGTQQQRIEDVLIGDVWLCSGQSNMELQVHRSLDSRSEIANAHDRQLRLLTIPQESSVVPRSDYRQAPTWQPLTPDSVHDFSAACYYFARELRKDVDVPMGLIDAAWGGSRIQAWLSGPALQQLGDYAAPLDVLARYAADPAQAQPRWGELWQQWWRQRPGIAADDAPWQPQAGGEWTATVPDADWVAPALAERTGLFWYRTTVNVDAAQAAQAASLELGSVDEIDMTWVNGQAVGSESGGQGRRYRLPAGLLHAGHNTLVVSVLNTYRAGGIGGDGAGRGLRLADGSRVPLDERDWQYRQVPAEYGTPPVAPWMSASGLSTLYNGMIAPLAGYGLRGALWYQGESNTFEAARYDGLLQAYRRDLRAGFGADLPLLVVQLANYGAAPLRPGASDWALLRQAQQRAVAADRHSGLAVAIDIGERGDIHPANKQELGRRLARAARHVAYGQSLAPSGPVATQARHDGDNVVVRFVDVEQGLVAYGGLGPVGFELCGDSQASCRYASARIDGDQVRLKAEAAGAATRVRYGWADSPVVTLYDGNGLPAGPFELPIQ